MRHVLKTEITIDASPQTVWSVMDDLGRYPDWNPLLPELVGKTMVGRTVAGRMIIQGGPEIPLAPVMTRIVGARELRWITIIPGDEGFSAEHYFILTPLEGGRTHLIHDEIFDGPTADQVWELFDTLGRQSYEAFNVALKARVEALAGASVSIHPAVQASDSNASGENPAPEALTIKCHCAADPVEVAISGGLVHNHLCGCSKCWKPDGALVSQVAIVAADTAKITHHEEKVAAIDAGQSIVRMACTGCGVHMLGRVDNPDHHFFGMTFVHPELATAAVNPPIEFAGFLSSLIEQGVQPSIMQAVRGELREAGIPTYDAFSPEIMDLIAWHKIKAAA